MTAPTLPEFLLARIAEREADADSWVYDAGGGDLWSLKDEVLAECETKRRVVDYLVKCERLEAQGHVTDYSQGELAAYRSAVSALSTVYADHPDYRQEWTP